MADEAANPSGSGGDTDPQLTFHVKSSSDAKFTVTVPATITVGDLKIKLSASEYADIPPERQRLIYSGRVLKDHDTLETVKIKDGHTVHLVKGAASNARQNPATQPEPSSSRPAGGADVAGTGNVPTNMSTGPGNNPLSGLTGARYAGFHGLPGAEMFGPDGGMGPPPNPDELIRMLENPQFAQQMNEALSNPQFMDMIANSPMMRNNPLHRQLLQDPTMRRMMLDPNMLRMQLQMSRAMSGEGAGGGNFPAPGVTDNTAQGQQQQQDQDEQAAGERANPFATGGGAANPFAELFGNQGQGQGQASPNPFGGMFGGGASAGASAGAGAGVGAGAGGNRGNPFAEMAQNMMQNPEAMRNALQAMETMFGGSTGAPGQQGIGGNNAGSEAASRSPRPNPFGAFNPLGMYGAFPGGGLGQQQEQDSRPPEERYAEQLRQLNEMGFYEFDRNVQALRRSGGNVQGAVNFLLQDP
ncbi:hypothetical protein BDY21DRAFT_356153 [Lineolata rhizophorae]|uniref:Deubiquitination-protection protein dph1 n=1 Tax=Lineolata rhizophorae TaxID=578093 RepID=A0A6A6NP68_9PEZI|nr:hypothetical protein BDY21DRAFT_356153 [Lineolata rhizophorae]